MTGKIILQRFELFMDDTTELSSDEELALLNKIYNYVGMLHEWNYLRRVFVGTASGTTVALPSDFSYMITNSNYSETNTYSGYPEVFVGADYEPYKVITFSDRRQYRNKSGYCYVDLENSNLVFTDSSASGKAVEFDYHSVPTDITLTTSPLIPSQFQDIVYHGMCVDDFIIQQSDKAKSYAGENERKFKTYLDNMLMWDSKFVIA